MGIRKNQTNILICLALVVITLAVYGQVVGFRFIAYDDPEYVANNTHVLSGISLDSLGWAFTTTAQANWHPLTWISLMIDAQLGGGSPGVFHATNVLLHLANTLLLFLFLQIVTGFRWRSAAVAALFALHPLHVESVAWVAERKDVLSTLLWLLTMLAYARYVKRPTIGSYLLIVAVFAAGLMCKPMLVSLPFVLLLMDVWPLKRGFAWWPLVREKLPFFAMAAASCGVTYWAQLTGGAVSGQDLYPFGVRAANALVSYTAYIWKMVWPLDLVVIYPHPYTSLPVWQVIGSAVLLALVSLVAVRSARKSPYVLVGWMWYVLTLLPVIGLVQVGEQAMADRYTYVPLIGLFLILAMAVPELIARRGAVGESGWSASPALVVLGVLYFLGLAALSQQQAGYWRNSFELYGHALRVDPNNYLAHLGMGNAFSLKERPADAVNAYLRALELNPHKDKIALPSAHLNLGLALNKLGRFEESIPHLSLVAKHMPGNADAHDSLGVALGSLGQVDRAIEHLRLALAADPASFRARNNLGCAYAQKGDYEAARREFQSVLSMDPSNEDARRFLAAADAAQSRQSDEELN